MGFQDQKGAGVITVEGELKSSLGENFPCAGRTDKVATNTITHCHKSLTLFYSSRMCPHCPK